MSRPHASLSAQAAAAVRPEAEGAPTSGIVDAMSYGRGRDGLIPLWAGEGDLRTPAFIARAAARALEGGETFYTWQRGIPELREALARYHERLYGRGFAADRFFVTTGGMHAAQIATRIAAGPGDEVLIPSPAWPNFEGAVTVAGARTVPVPMRSGAAGWVLDLATLEAAVTPRTRAIVVNSPSNPTGWTAGLDELRQILDIARRHGLWIVADEIYGRFFHGDGDRAPSFHDVMQADDRVLFVQTFSKNWAMTGWRVGWLEAPPELGAAIENLIQYSTSGVPVATQRAAMAAIAGGEELIRSQVERARINRDLLFTALRGTGRLRCALPDGAFYLFCGFEGVTDSRGLALKLVDEAGVGVAPGSAFGAGDEGFVRLCYARRSDEVVEVARRIAAWLKR